MFLLWLIAFFPAVYRFPAHEADRVVCAVLRWIMEEPRFCHLTYISIFGFQNIQELRAYLFGWEKRMRPFCRLGCFGMCSGRSPLWKRLRVLERPQTPFIRIIFIGNIGNRHLVVSSKPQLVAGRVGMAVKSSRCFETSKLSRRFVLMVADVRCAGVRASYCKGTTIGCDCKGICSQLAEDLTKLK